MFNPDNKDLKILRLNLFFWGIIHFNPGRDVEDENLVHAELN